MALRLIYEDPYARDAHPTKPPKGRHGGVYRGRWSTTTPNAGEEPQGVAIYRL